MASRSRGLVIRNRLISHLRNVVARIRQNNQQSVSQFPSTDCLADLKYRCAWRIGIKLLVIHNNTITECIIIGIVKADFKVFLPTKVITLQFQDGSTKEFDRMSNKIQSHPDFVANRQKLTRYCCIERYSSSQKQWISAYIDKCKTNMSSTKSRTFWMKRKKYNEWSPNIRCCSNLLDLVRDSMILVFDGHSVLWCFGKIIDIIQVQMKQNEKSLDVFKVHYQKNGKMYLKYAHQFSANIGCIDNSICTKYEMSEKDISLLLQGFGRKSLAQNQDININDDVLSVVVPYIDLQELDVYMNRRDIKKAKIVEIDSTDLKYHRLLLCGSIRKSSNDDGDIFINMDVLSIMVKYIGLFYELVMVIEAKSYLLANNTSTACIHNGRVPLPSKMIESDKSDDEDNENTYLYSIDALEVQTDYEENEENESSKDDEREIVGNHHDSSDDNSFSLKSEEGLTVPTEWELT